jgi:hypothetical protein
MVFDVLTIDSDSLNQLQIDGEFVVYEIGKYF